MEVRYSKHLQIRLKLRGIDIEVPKRIYERAEERFLDRETGNQVAVQRVQLYGKEREVMIAYQKEEKPAIILTVHPLKKEQKQRKIASGRWIRL